ncbi:MAG: helix-turn-helix transcriptional regulator, partial [Kiritimatiellae bacterium]|nr:helix-turn-helix transcriptional regulator [Kiritimatiellia bacterium]
MDIKTIRESLNLTQAELALALEVSRNYVCLLEKGHRLP